MTEPTESLWGWIRYERTFWINETGHRLYIGHFKQDNDPHCWTVTVVRFWAKRPIVALRSICASGTDPATFRDQIVN